MDEEAAIAGATIVGRVEEAAAAERAAEGLELVLVGEMERDVDAAGPLEFIEKGLAKTQAEFDRSQMLAGLRDRHHAANAQSGDAAFQPDNRLAFLVGGQHRLAKAGKIVAEFRRLVDPKIGD